MSKKERATLVSCGTKDQVFYHSEANAKCMTVQGIWMIDQVELLSPAFRAQVSNLASEYGRVYISKAVSSEQDSNSFDVIQLLSIQRIKLDYRRAKHLRLNTVGAKLHPWPVSHGEDLTLMASVADEYRGNGKREVAHIRYRYFYLNDSIGFRMAPDRCSYAEDGLFSPILQHSNDSGDSGNNGGQCRYERKYVVPPYIFHRPVIKRHRSLWQRLKLS